MNEENMMDDETPLTTRSESAFSGTRDEVRDSSLGELSQVGSGNVGMLTTARPPFPYSRRSDVVRAIRYNRSFTIYVPKWLIPKHPNKNDVIEVLLSKQNPISETFPLYTTHNPTSRRANASLFQIVTKKGECFKITKVSMYRTEKLVLDFNETRPDELRNVELELVGSRVAIRVDGATQTAEARLSAYQGEALLDLEIGGRPELRLRKGVDGFRMQRLPHRETVISIRARQDAMFIEYRTSKKRSESATRIVDAPRRPLGRPEDPQSNFAIKLISAPDSFEGDYVVEISTSIGKDATDRMRTATSLAEYSMLRGEIGEAMVNSILQLIGCVEITNHPESQSNGYRNSEKKGPDSLRLIPGSGVGYFEIKWWRQFHMAVWESRRLVRDYCDRFPDSDGRCVRAGYIAVLDWRPESAIARLYVEKVV